MSGINTFQRSWKLTRSSLLYLLCRDSEDIEYFNHYLHDDVRHRHGWWNFGIRLEAFEEVLNALKDVDEGLLGCTNILSRLRSFGSSSVARRCEKNADLEEKASAREDHFRG